jgi:hypothetical protein
MATVPTAMGMMAAFICICFKKAWYSSTAPSTRASAISATNAGL